MTGKINGSVAAAQLPPLPNTNDPQVFQQVAMGMLWRMAMAAGGTLAMPMAQAPNGFEIGLECVRAPMPDGNPNGPPVFILQAKPQKAPSLVVAGADALARLGPVPGVK